MSRTAMELAAELKERERELCETHTILAELYTRIDKATAKLLLLGDENAKLKADVKQLEMLADHRYRPPCGQCRHWKPYCNQPLGSENRGLCNVLKSMTLERFWCEYSEKVEVAR